MKKTSEIKRMWRMREMRQMREMREMREEVHKTLSKYDTRRLLTSWGVQV